MVTQFYSIIIYFGLILFEQRLHVAGEDKVIGYRSGDAIAVQTYRLSNNVPSASYDYYTLPFCRPDEDFLDQAKNLQRILGKGLVSPYQLHMKNDTICSSTCEDNEPAVVKASKAKLLMNLIEKNYTFNFMADGILPRRRHTDPNTGEVSYPYEIWMGWVENDGKIFLNNHLDMELIYEENSQGLYRIVEFIINPRSVKSITFDQQSEECTGISNAADPYELKAEDQKIYWTYSVTWKRSNVSSTESSSTSSTQLFDASQKKEVSPASSLESSSSGSVQFFNASDQKNDSATVMLSSTNTLRLFSTVPILIFTYS